ncbi:hypothetical protein GCM10018793_02870 [Streptomyces sulfonofaciens]|uniref:Glycosyl transferase n=1 Tax=Streptomyces sulfonofaciens TaxID=68272 RepID=A0A919FPA5_9ACTN|nr:glycosyltransferase family 39 protein [Streptomyces sulfonofaciens]GHH69818.1 hypothetical protein GCM10018793_02870 [Streptomyces sulfonofaciens]
MTTCSPALRPTGTGRLAGRLARLWRGRPGDAAWARPALLLSLLATGLLYLWNLSASGYANSFYAAAAQAGSRSWKAFFFGSLDAANAITVDKPPAALWPMALSVRIFGLGSWQILVPQVLMGVATAAVLHAAVRRRFSATAGLLAVVAFALTPVAALMFRFDNPDALLALLMTVTVYCVLRALEQGRTRWLVWAGAAVGLAFLVKTLQAFLILPPLALLYAVCAPVRPLRRFGQLLLATVVLVVSGGWWVALVELWPASSRPYIGGSQHNSFLELTFGYNGFGRISGDETGSVGGGGGPGGGGHWGDTGLDRMFGPEVGGQISWLLPAALVLLAAGLLVTRRTARTDTARAAFLAWGGSLLVTAAVFSFMAGIFHQYYTVALAPYLAALVGMGATVLWEERSRGWAPLVLAGTVALTGWWSFVLLGRTPDYLPWLRWAVLAGAIAGTLGLAAVGHWTTGRQMADSQMADSQMVNGRTMEGRTMDSRTLSGRTTGRPGPDAPGAAPAGSTADRVASTGSTADRVASTGSTALRVPSTGRTARRAALAAVGAGLAACLAGPLAYTLTTVETGHAGSIVTAGPPGAAVMGRGGGGWRGGAPGGRWAGPAALPEGATALPRGAAGRSGPFGRGRTRGTGQGGNAAGSGAFHGPFPGGFPGGSGAAGGPGGARGGGMRGGARGGGGGGMGGLLDGARVSEAAAALLERNAGAYTWPAAAVGSQNAASYQLATGDPVMAIGGFNGSDPSPTLAQFKTYVADGRIHYFIAGGTGRTAFGGRAGGEGGFSRGGSRVSSDISTWVEATFRKVTVGDAAFYDLTRKA